MSEKIHIPWTAEPSQTVCNEFFEEVCEKMVPRVLTFAHKLTGDGHAAEDCAQEVFSAFFKELPNFNQSTKVVPWLLSTTRNQAFKSNKRAKVRFMVKLEKLSLMSDDKNPLSAALSKEQAEQLKALIHELPKQQRNAFLMREVEGASYEEIGCLLDCTEDSAKKACMRAKQTLRAIITKDLCKKDESALKT